MSIMLYEIILLGETNQNSSVFNDKSNDPARSISLLQKLDETEIFEIEKWRHLISRRMASKFENS